MSSSTHDPYVAYLRHLRAARVTAQNYVFTERYHLARWDNTGCAVRGQFFRFGITPGANYLAGVEGLRADHERNRSDGKRLRFATLWELLGYAARPWNGLAEVLALGSSLHGAASSMRHVAQLEPARRLRTVHAEDCYAPSSSVLCVVVNG